MWAVILVGWLSTCSQVMPKRVLVQRHTHPRLGRAGCCRMGQTLPDSWVNQATTSPPFQIFDGQQNAKDRSSDFNNFITIHSLRAGSVSGQYYLFHMH